MPNFATFLFLSEELPLWSSNYRYRLPTVLLELFNLAYLMIWNISEDLEYSNTLEHQLIAKTRLKLSIFYDRNPDVSFFDIFNTPK